MFCSTSVKIHLLRGLCAFALIGLSIYWSIGGGLTLLAAIPALVVALVLLRGCPMCWLCGLFETMALRKGKRANRPFD